MLFNSLQFLLFFAITTILYFQLNQVNRWKLLLFASCFFYMAFKPIYILILFFTIIVDYIAGIYIERNTGRTRRLILVTSILSNVGVLVIFKYYPFINDNILYLSGLFNQRVALPALNIILPIGLSFHTFQAMSYTIEVYRGKQKAEKHFGIYALYVMFYPQLVAGPIERPQNMIHQFYEYHKFDFERIKAGLARMAFGFLKKVVIADRLAVIANDSFNNVAGNNGLSLFISTLAFTFQIYCDFSAYSDIALGSAEVLGFKLMENFRSPYFSTSISEFWARWHISLSSWFRDYVYIPLGGNRVAKWHQYSNLMIVFLLSGFWHGADWKFLIWGGVHGFYLIFAIVKDELLEKAGFKTGSNIFIRFLNLVTTFALVAFAWIFFRANSLADSILTIKKITGLGVHDHLNFTLGKAEILFTVLCIFLLLVKEKYVNTLPTGSNWSFSIIFSLLVMACYFFGYFTVTSFIYFQF